MKATIEIYFENDLEFMAHLQVIRQQALRAFDRNPDATGFEFEDSNYYGCHTVKIIND